MELEVYLERNWNYQVEIRPDKRGGRGAFAPPPVGYLVVGEPSSEDRSFWSFFSYFDDWLFSVFWHCYPYEDWFVCFELYLLYYLE